MKHQRHGCHQYLKVDLTIVVYFLIQIVIIKFSFYFVKLVLFFNHMNSINN